MSLEESDHRTRHEFTRLLQLSNGLSLFKENSEFGLKNWLSIDGFYASLGFEHAFFNVHVARDPQRADVNVISVRNFFLSFLRGERVKDGIII